MHGQQHIKIGTKLPLRAA